MPIPTLPEDEGIVKISLVLVALITKLLEALLPTNHCSLLLVSFMVRPRYLVFEPERVIIGPEVLS